MLKTLRAELVDSFELFLSHNSSEIDISDAVANGERTGFNENLDVKIASIASPSRELVFLSKRITLAARFARLERLTHMFEDVLPDISPIDLFLPSPVGLSGIDEYKVVGVESS